MSRGVSPSSGRPYGLAQVCRTWRVARATVYRHRPPPPPPRRPGPVGPMPDVALVAAIRAVLAARPPLPRRRASEGLGPAAPCRGADLEAPGAAAHARARPARALAGRIAPWPAQSRRHHHPRGRGRDVGHRPDHDRHRRGPGGGVRRPRPLLGGVRRPPRRAPRHPLRGPRAAAPGRAAPLRRLRQGRRGGPRRPARPRVAVHGRRLPEGAALPLLGIESSPAFVRAPEGNGCAERFIRTLQENLLWVRTFDTVEELRRALLDFRETDNATWLIERHGFRPLSAVRPDQLSTAALAA